jgi:hypothetical protein
LVRGLSQILVFFELEELMAILNLVNGYKTYIAAIGLAGLAVYQFSQGQFDSGYQSILGALTAAGLRHAIAKASYCPEALK